jgi:transcriptional adapter 2-alpha
MPKRGEFDVEFDCDAEELLADMEFLDWDDDEEMSFKDKQIYLYNNRLDQRIARKKLLIERNLLLDTKRFKNKDERETNNYYKIFMRLLKSLEHYDRVMGVINRHRTLGQAIERLMQFRAMGKESLAEVL